MKSTLNLENMTKVIILKLWVICIAFLIIDFTAGFFSFCYYVNNLAENDSNGIYYLLCVDVPIGLFFGLILALTIGDYNESIEVKIPSVVYDKLRNSFYAIIGYIFITIFALMCIFGLYLFFLFFANF